GSLTPGDAPTLAVYAETVAQWIRAKRDVEKRGQILSETRFSKAGNQYEVEVLNPSVRIMQESSRQMLQQAKALGLSPDSREKIKPPKAKAKNEPPRKGSIGELLLMLPRRSEQEEQEEDNAEDNRPVQ